MMYIRGDVAIIQGKCPHAGVAPKDVPLHELSVKKDSYQYDTNSCMMSIPPTWHKRDLNANIHSDNMSIPSTWRQRDLEQNMTNHDNKYITQMILHHIKQESWSKYENKIPHQTSNMYFCNTMHRKISTWTHYICLTSKAILRSGCQTAEASRTINLAASIAWNNCSHMLNADTCTPLRKVAENRMKKWKI